MLCLRSEKMMHTVEKSFKHWLLISFDMINENNLLEKFVRKICSTNLFDMINENNLFDAQTLKTQRKSSKQKIFLHFLAVV